MADKAAAAADMRLSEEAEGEVARAQDWTCPACGNTVAGGCGTMTLATVPPNPAAIPVIMHEPCIDDARRAPRLADVAELAARAGEADQDAARKARAGAMKHANAAAAEIAELKKRVKAAEADKDKAEAEAATLRNELYTETRLRGRG